MIFKQQPFQAGRNKRGRKLKEVFGDLKAGEINHNGFVLFPKKCISVISKLSIWEVVFLFQAGFYIVYL